MRSTEEGVGLGFDASELAAKEEALHKRLRECGSVVIGFSGGVDSAYLAKASLDALGRTRVLAVTGRSPSYPEVQYKLAMQVLRQLGLPHLEIATNELDDSNYAANPTNRCYYCKSELYRRLLDIARTRGYAAVLDGSNADDLDDHRPGLGAAHELGVRSPLQEVGLAKAEIRELSRRAGLPTWEAPASPCLASRIVYGLEVTTERLGQIERTEAELRALAPWRALRVRHHGALARLEVAPEDMWRLADPEFRRRVAAVMRGGGFARVCLDLLGYRRGSFNQGASASRALDGRGADVAVLDLRQEELGKLLEAERATVIEEWLAAGYRYVTVELR